MYRHVFVDSIVYVCTQQCSHWRASGSDPGIQQDQTEVIHWDHQECRQLTLCIQKRLSFGPWNGTSGAFGTPACDSSAHSLLIDVVAINIADESIRYVNSIDHISNTWYIIIRWIYPGPLTFRSSAWEEKLYGLHWRIGAACWESAIGFQKWVRQFGVRPPMSLDYLFCNPKKIILFPRLTMWRNGNPADFVPLLWVCWSKFTYDVLSLFQSQQVWMRLGFSVAFLTLTNKTMVCLVSTILVSP